MTDSCTCQKGVYELVTILTELSQAQAEKLSGEVGRVMVPYQISVTEDLKAPFTYSGPCFAHQGICLLSKLGGWPVRVSSVYAEWTQIQPTLLYGPASVNGPDA